MPVPSTPSSLSPSSSAPALQWLAYLQSQARLTLLSAGFSLAFGSMFAKTYRVHRIFTYSGIGLCKDKILQDSKLILLVCALLIIDGLVVTLWVVTDPLDRHLSNLTLEISAIDRSVVYQPQVSRAAWLFTIDREGDNRPSGGLLLPLLPVPVKLDSSQERWVGKWIEQYWVYSRRTS